MSPEGRAGTGVRFTERLRLEPVEARHGKDLWTIHNDEAVIPWYDGWDPTPEEAQERARQWALGWALFGVHKWMAYDCETGDLVGRGGLSRTPADEDWGRICRFLPAQPWTTEILTGPGGGRVHANWVEIGWALGRPYWGRGYAAEIGRAGLDFAFKDLHLKAVVSCTSYRNLRSRAVMERIGMRYAGLLDDLDGGEDMTVHVLLAAEHRAP